MGQLSSAACQTVCHLYVSFTAVVKGITNCMKQAYYLRRIKSQTSALRYRKWQLIVPFTTVKQHKKSTQLYLRSKLFKTSLHMRLQGVQGKVSLQNKIIQTQSWAACNFKSCYGGDACSRGHSTGMGTGSYSSTNFIPFLKFPKEKRSSFGVNVYVNSGKLLPFSERSMKVDFMEFCAWCFTCFIFVLE